MRVEPLRHCDRFAAIAKVGALLCASRGTLPKDTERAAPSGIETCRSDSEQRSGHGTCEYRQSSMHKLPSSRRRLERRQDAGRPARRAAGAACHPVLPLPGLQNCIPAYAGMTSETHSSIGDSWIIASESVLRRRRVACT